MLKSVTTGPIGVNFDPAATVMSGASPSEAFAVLREFVAHVLVRDAIWGADGEGNEVPVGRGEVPWDELLFLLRESDFGGWLTVDRTQGEDRAGDAGRACNICSRFTEAERGRVNGWTIPKSSRLRH